MGILHHLFHGDVAHGDEGTHVGGTLTRVGTVVLAHVNEFGGFLHHTVSGFAHRLRLTHEGDDGAVGSHTGIHVQQLDAFHFLDFSGHLVNDILVAAFADIRHAFDELFHYCLI